MALEPVGASPIRDAKAEVGQRAALAESPQADRFAFTTFDEVRCGGAVTVAAAVLRGPRGISDLLDGLDAPRTAQTVAAARAEMRAQGFLSSKTIQTLQDLVYAAASDGEPGTSPLGQQAQAKIARLPARVLDASALAPAPVSSTSKPTPIELAASWRRHVRDTLRPGEAAPLFLSNGAQGLGHIVLVGRDRSGSLYVYDSGRTPGILYDGRPVDSAAINFILTRAQRFHGTNALTIRDA